MRCFTATILIISFASAMAMGAEKNVNAVNVAEKAQVAEVLDTSESKDDIIVPDGEPLKLESLGINLDDLPESDPQGKDTTTEDPCRKIRDLTTRLRELGTQIAVKSTELIRVRGEERVQVRDQIRRLREDVSKTNSQIRENTRDCARSRTPTFRPPTLEAAV